MASVAPRDPRQTVTRVGQLPTLTVADAAVRKRLADLGQLIPPKEKQTAQALGAFHKAEIERWWPIIKSANIKVEPAR